MKHRWLQLPNEVLLELNQPYSSIQLLNTFEKIYIIEVVDFGMFTRDRYFQRKF